MMPSGSPRFSVSFASHKPFACIYNNDFKDDDDADIKESAQTTFLFVILLFKLHFQLLLLPLLQFSCLTQSFTFVPLKYE
jgi:hypothetical protein